MKTGIIPRNYGRYSMNLQEGISCQNPSVILKKTIPTTF